MEIEPALASRRSWIPLLVVNALPILFGASYIWFPSDTVKAADGTEGLIHVEPKVWGAFVMASALVMVVAVLAGFRRGRRWGWSALWYDVPWFVAVALIEPDYFFPLIFAAIAAVTLLRSRARYAYRSPGFTRPAS